MSNQIAHILRAASFAADKHRDQRRKDPQASPYINHPIDVAEVLVRYGRISDLDLLTAALLHDTVEDTETSLDEIGREFGTAVRDLVAEVTDDKSLEKEQRKQRQVDTAAIKSPRARQLKIADKICNVQDIRRDSPQNWSDVRKAEYLDWATRVVAGCRGVNAGLESRFDEVLQAARERLS